MGLFSKRLHDHEARIRSGGIGWFGSVAIGDGKETVLATGLWISGELNEAPATISSRALEPPPWFGSYELRPPGQ